MDGVNWFRCECAPGFAGPDCRISKQSRWIEAVGWGNLSILGPLQPTSVSRAGRHKRPYPDRLRGLSPVLWVPSSSLKS